LRVLITGYSGFAGSHLTDHLIETTDWEIWGTVFGRRAVEGCRSDRVHELPVDLRDPSVVGAVVAEADPDVVFHLAGEASVQVSWQQPWPTFETNIRMQFNLHEALLAHARPARMVVVVSNEVYGAVDDAHLPTDETAPLAPLNPYAVSKAMQDMLAAMYGRAHKMAVIRLRPFTHIGPRQDERFVAADFARQIAEIEAGRRAPVVRVGNLSAERDLTDVRDMVRAYRLAAERGRADEVYNLGSGRAYPVRTLLDLLVTRSRVPVQVETDPARMRPADVPRTLCDAGKARRELGWAPEIPLERTVTDLLEEWRVWVAAGGRPEL
jgi:GDP-4-dehydro-6-deoxy-D-mannose reductase